MHKSKSVFTIIPNSKHISMSKIKFFLAATKQLPYFQKIKYLSTYNIDVRKVIQYYYTIEYLNDIYYRSNENASPILITFKYMFLFFIECLKKK